MSEREPILCPECGWTGERSALDVVEGGYRCPICEEAVEVVE